MKERIKTIAKAKGITMKELARLTGRKYQALNCMMNGNPTLSALNNISNALGCNLIELLDPGDDYAHVYSDDGKWFGVQKK